MVTTSKLYLLTGKENFFKHQYLKKIKSYYSKSSKWVDFEIYYANEDKLPDIQKDLSLFSSSNQTKINIIKNIDKLPKNNQGRLLKFLENLSVGNIVVLITSDENFKNDFIKKLVALKNIKEIKCNVLKSKELYDWVIQEFKKRKNIEIKKQALDVLLGKTGSDLWRLNNEIEKLISYKNKGIIDKDDIDLIVNKNIFYDIFVLVNNICNKDICKSIDMLSDIYIYNMPIEKVIGAVGWQLRRMLRAKLYFNKGLSKSEVLNLLNINYYFADDFISQLNKFKTDDLEKAINNLSEVDNKIKTGYIEPRLAVEIFIMSLIID